MRLLRSVLYVPAVSSKFIAKVRAGAIAVDAVIWDLEDAVSPSKKAEARSLLCSAMGDGETVEDVVSVVRVNALRTPWGFDDVAAIGASSFAPAALVLPKAESADEVAALVAAMNAAGLPASTEVWCMVETPLGVLRCEEIARSSRVSTLVMGTSDLSKELGARVSDAERAPLATALQLSVLAAKAHGVAIVDGVYLDLSDDAGFVRQCAAGRAMGFDGKSLIHPRTVRAANAAFSPTADDAEHAARVIEAHAEAEARGDGVAVLDGELVENLHAARAEETLALWRAAAARDGGAPP